MGPRSGDCGNKRARAGRPPGSPLQWGRDLEIAEIRFHFRVKSFGLSRFNGAAIWRSRKCECHIKILKSDPSFNGAAIWRSRKFPTWTPSWSGPTSFNGAAIWRSRKSRGLAGDKLIATMLQWGRDLEIAEMLAIPVLLLARGPLQWGRDLEIAEMGGAGSGLGPRRSFNGAAIWRSRKYPRFPRSRAFLPRFNGAAIWRSRK